MNNVYYVVSRNDDSYTLGVRSKSGKGYFLSNAGITQDISSVNGYATAIAAGFSSWCATGASCYHGYAVLNGVGTWTASWKLVN